MIIFFLLSINLRKSLLVFKNAQFTKFVSPKFSTLSFPEEMIDSIKVEPHLGKPIIKIGLLGIIFLKAFTLLLFISKLINFDFTVSKILE